MALVLTVSLFATGRVVEELERTSLCRMRASPQSTTNAQINIVAHACAQWFRATGRLPTGLEQLMLEPLQPCGDPLVRWSNTRDAWNAPLSFAPLSEHAFTIVSLAADGMPGGSGRDADVVWFDDCADATPPDRAGG